MRQAEALSQRFSEEFSDVGGLQQAVLAFEQIERGVRRRAGQRVAHIGRPVHQGVQRIVGPESVENLLRGDGSGQRQRTAAKALAERHNVGRDIRCFASKHGAGAPEAGEDFVEDQQQLVFVGGGAQAAKRLLVMENHAARALHQRLHHDAREFAGMAFEEGVEGGNGFSVSRQRDHVMLG
jgi:hypothetical protein